MFLSCSVFSEKNRLKIQQIQRAAAQGGSLPGAKVVRQGGFLYKRVTLMVLLVSAPVLAQGCSLKARPGSAEVHEKSVIEEKWGIRVEGLRLTAEGHMCDFRFRVIDAAKAASLINRKNSASLLNETTGMMTYVPAPPKAVLLRQTVKPGSPAEGKTYFIFFANPGKLIKTGTRATVSIGDFVLPGLVVQ